MESARSQLWGPPCSWWARTWRICDEGLNYLTLAATINLMLAKANQSFQTLPMFHHVATWILLLSSSNAACRSLMESRPTKAAGHMPASSAAEWSQTRCPKCRLPSADRSCSPRFFCRWATPANSATPNQGRHLQWRRGLGWNTLRIVTFNPP